MKRKVLQLSTIDLTLYKFILPLMKELRVQGFEVIAACKDYGFLDKIKEEGFVTYDIDIARNLNPLKIIKSIYQVYGVLKKEKIDIIHVHTPIAAFVGRVAAFLAGVRVKFYTVHGFIIDKPLFYFIEKFMARYFTDYIFTVNQEDYERAVDEGFISPERITNINSVGIDIDKFNPSLVLDEEKETLRKSLGINKNDRIIGYIGRIVAEKGVLDLLESYLMIRDQGLKLLLVGPWDLGERDGDTVDKIKKIVKEKGLEREVLLIGYREDIPRMLSIMDIFVLPSYREGMPVSLLEAMAMGLPVITTNIRGCREAIDEKTGLLFEPGNSQQFADCLRKILANEDLRRELGGNGRNRVVEKYSLDKVISRQMKIYKAGIEQKCLKK